MDPDLILESWKYNLSIGEIDDALERAYALVDWLGRGGRCPNWEKQGVTHEHFIEWVNGANAIRPGAPGGSWDRLVEKERERYRKWCEEREEAQ